MASWKERTQVLLGKTVMASLECKHVLIVGAGGVGAYVSEMLCRAGVGHLTIVDADTVNESNINRQLVALHSTIGRTKTEVLGERLRDINPELNLNLITDFMKDEKIPQLLDACHYDYVVDAIDSLAPKVFLIVSTLERHIPLISSMGAGAKTDISKIQVTDISKSYNCNLARMVRKRLTKFGIKKGFPVCFSSELANPAAIIPCEGERNKITTVGTISYMPATFGNFIAAYILRQFAAEAEL
jgi:tRNA A37 threonylcarbamoyladenosine dehydratase